MSVERTKFDGFDELEIFCSDCGQGHGRSYMDDHFRRMIADAREDGWQIKADGSGWRHRCPDCVGIKVEAPSADSLGHVYDDDIEELL